MKSLTALREEFLEILLTAAEERPDRATFIGDELEWVIYERDCMLKAVNKERSDLGKKPITAEELKPKEQQAFGHSDYASKFALYCAMLVFEE